MSDSNAMLVIICLCYVVSLVASIFLLLKPPEKINPDYGYRTPRSMKNIESWKYANKLAAKLSFLLAHINLLLSLWVYHSAPKFKHPLHVDVLLIIGILIVLGLLLILIVECKLKKTFRTEA